MTGYNSKRQMAQDKVAQPSQEPEAVYGYCPECGAKGVQRERRPDGNDKCINGHIYPSSKALTQPAQEPVATKTNEGITLHLGWDDLPVGAKLYTAPPQRPWVGLTPEETSGFTSQEMTVVKYVSKVLQEKNHGSR